MKPCQIVVLISGSGSNLQALIDAIKRGDISGRIAAVISNRPGVKGLERAAAENIPALAIDHKRFGSRAEFDQALAETIDQYHPDLLVLAGFMRILTPEFVNHYTGKMLNIHPSRLPRYQGLHTHKRAIEAGDRHHGASIHFVTAELDGGPVILQSRLPIRPEHTPETLAADLLPQEHALYPLAVQWFCEGRLKYTPEGVRLDDQLLSKPIQYEELTSKHRTP
jgi:phosphoribosylglycinamide formyltransferase-1